MTVLDHPVRPARLGATVGWAVAAGVVLDIGLRGGPTNLVVVVGLGIVLLAVLVHGGVRRAEARWLLAAAAVPGLFLAVRTSPWLAASNLLAVVGLVGTAAAHARSGSLLDTTPMRLSRRLVAVTIGAVRGPLVLRPLVRLPARARANVLVRVGRAAAVALPPLLVVVLLLASADAVFAGLLVPDVNGGPVIGHLLFAGALALAALSTVVATGTEPEVDEVRPGGYGVIEVATMLGLAAVVLGLFVLSQLLATTGTGRRLVESAGLTPAEYARGGFFQLCWATAVLVGFLGVVRGLAAPGVLARRGLRALAAAVPVLALGLVVVSLRRLAVYDDAFGLTMLRLWAMGGSVWMGALLVMLALRNSGVGEERNWLMAGAATVALALVLTADVVNPEAVVVRHNTARAGTGAELDAVYLSRLSDDAVPALLDAAATAEEPIRTSILTALRCGDDATGTAALNLGAGRGADARRRACPR